MISGDRRRMGLTLSLGALLMSGATLAQDVPPRLVFDLGAGISHATNPDLAVSGGASTTRGDLRLGLDFASVTPGQDLRLSLGGLLRATDSETAFRDPAVTLSYAAISANAEVTARAQWQETPVDLFEPLLNDDGTLASTDLVARLGTVTTGQLGFGLVTGKTGPLGFDLKASSLTRDYSDTSESSVYDSESQSLSGGVHLRGAMGGDLGLSLGLTRSQSEDLAQTDRETTRASLSYARPLSADLTLQAALGMTRAETTRAGIVSASSEGATGSLGLTRALPNGQARLSFDLARDAAGARQTLRLGRALDLPTGALEADLGYSGRSGDAGQMIGSLSWSQDLPTDKLSVRLSRQITLGDDDSDVAQSALNAQWSHQVNPGARLGLGYGLTMVEGIGGSTAEGLTRQTLTASWTQSLTADWALQTGLTLRALERDATGSASDQAVFVTLARKFVLLP